MKKESMFKGSSLVEDSLIYDTHSGKLTCKCIGETGASWSVGQVGPRAISLN